MKTEFTSGPWDAWLGKSRFGMTGPAAAASTEAVFAMRDGFGKNLFVEISSESKTPPAIALGNTLAEAQANARLIAAAPDLFVMLQEAADALSGGLWDYSPEQDEHQRCNAVIDKCRAVLSKATGEQA